MSAEKLKIARNTLKKKQKEMAELVGISHTAWQDYERGKRIPSGKVFKELFKLGFNVGWFFDDDVPMLLEDLAKLDPGDTAQEQGGAIIEDEKLSVIVDRWNKLPEDARDKIYSQVKKLTKPHFLYEAKVQRFMPYSQERADFIWERGCKDAGMPMMYDHYAIRYMDAYKLKNISDVDLYEASREWAKERLTVIRKVDKRNGNF